MSKDAFSARDRAVLVNELRSEIEELIKVHGTMTTLTVAEVVGTLEIIKLQLLVDSTVSDEEGEDE